MTYTHNHFTTLSLSLSPSLCVVWMPSMANTDPQLFCKRFQFYLGDIDYVSTIILFLHAYMYVHALTLVIFPCTLCTLHALCLLGSATVYISACQYLCQLFYIPPLCNKDLADALKSPHHWLALHIVGRGHTSYTCHIIRCPLSPCVLLAGVRKQHLSWILDVRRTVNKIHVHVVLSSAFFLISCPP